MSTQQTNERTNEWAIKKKPAVRRRSTYTYNRRSIGRKGRVTQRFREEFLEREGFVCIYCQGEAVCVDHIIPYSYCHDDSDLNLVASCTDCNLIASDKIFDNLAEKRRYILSVRNGIKWRKKIGVAIKPAECVRCGSLYKPNTQSTTLFLCSDCNIDSALLYDGDFDYVIIDRRTGVRTKQTKMTFSANKEDV